MYQTIRNGIIEEKPVSVTINNVDYIFAVGELAAASLIVSDVLKEEEEKRKKYEDKLRSQANDVGGAGVIAGSGYYGNNFLNL